VVRVCEAVVAGLSAGRKPAGSVKRSVGRVRSSPSSEGGDDMAARAGVCFSVYCFGGEVDRWWGLVCRAASKGPEAAEWGLPHFLMKP